jgi:hypothetical protein
VSCLCKSMMAPTGTGCGVTESAKRGAVAADGRAPRPACEANKKASEVGARDREGVGQR